MRPEIPHPSLGAKTEPSRPAPPAPWGAGAAFVALGLALGSILVIVLTAGLVEAFLRFGRHQGRELGAGLAATLVFQLALLGIALLLASRRYGFTLREYGYRSFPIRELYLPVVGVAGAWVVVIIYVTAASRFGLEKLVPTSNVPEDVFRFRNLTALFGVDACIVAPFVEETFFRGFVFRGLLSRRLAGFFRGHGLAVGSGFWPAAIMSGFVFALFHAQIGLLIPITGVGMIFAALFWRSGSLWPNILAHAGFNSVSFVAALLTHH